MEGYDVGIVGGGIVGTAAAAFLAEAGASVVLVERTDIAAGASGRNSGVVQHPFDSELAALYRQTLAIYRELAEMSADLELSADPAGLLLLSADEESVRIAASAIGTDARELDPQVLAPAQLSVLEPAIARGLSACRLATGYPVAPAAATVAFAARARRAGAQLSVGRGAASIELAGSRVIGIRDGSNRLWRCGSVLVAAGPWTPAVVPSWRDDPPIQSVWGVVVGVDLPDTPRHVLEELGINRPGNPPEEMFSLVTASGTTSVGSTFLRREPAAEERAGRVLEHAARFVPALSHATRSGVRVCARPVSVDGRPLIGPVEPFQGLYVCAGHGPWGISTGPASARLVVDEILGRAASDSPFSPSRLAAMPSRRSTSRS